MMRKSLCFMRSRPLLSHLAWLKNLLCYMIHYGTYRGAVVGLRGAVVGLRGAAVGPGAQLSAISAYLHTSYLGAQLSASPPEPLFQKLFLKMFGWTRKVLSQLDQRNLVCSNQINGNRSRPYLNSRKTTFRHETVKNAHFRELR